MMQNKSQLTLKQWLKNNKIKQVDFAKQGNFSRITINRICRGVAKPTFNTANRIEKLTKGQVKAEDLMKLKLALELPQDKT